ncbi:MAG: leucine-rich repeat domain-containing protein, partial [Tenuifilaceae bacterium]
MKTIDHHTDHAGIAHIISAMIEGMKIIRSVSIIFFTVTLFLSAFAVSASGENVTHNLVSVCSRTEQVRVAIQKEVDIQRFTSGAAGVVRCDTIKDYELKKIEYLQIIEKDITSLKPGDFEGLEGLKMLNLEGNKLQSLDSSVFSGLTNLENLVLARNPLIALQDELRVLTHLKRFDCSDCQLSEISTAAFGDNLELESVFLADNQLSQLPDGIFQNNDHLRIVDLSGNRFVQIPALFASEKSPLEAFDISRNLITVPDLSPLSRFQKLQVVNLSNNTFDSPDLQDTSVQMADHSFRIITSHDNRSIPFLNKISLPDSVALASSATAVQGVER